MCLLPRGLTTDDARSLGIAEADLGTFEPMSASRINIQPFLTSDAPADTYAYMAPLTSDMISRMKADGTMLAIAKFNDIAPYFSAEGANSYAFPFGEDADWTLANYGGAEGLLIPAKGMTIELTPANWRIRALHTQLRGTFRRLFRHRYRKGVYRRQAGHDLHVRYGLLLYDGRQPR